MNNETIANHHVLKSEFVLDAARFLSPEDVLAAINLRRCEKRAILASWLFDARAVEGLPALRQIDCGALVKVDHILRALYSLERAPSTQSSGKHSSGRSPMRWIDRIKRGKGRSDNDDDDPPPCPAAAHPKGRGPSPASASIIEGEPIAVAA